MNSIVKIATSYIGQQEISPNKSFHDPAFLKRMQKAGFYSGAPWCGFFCRMVWNEANEPIFSTSGTTITTMITSSAVKSMKAAARSGRFEVMPCIGGIAVWRSFKDGTQIGTGHMGIVTSCTITAWSDDQGVPISGSFSTIEGNTTKFGEREGKTVATRIRSFSWDRKDGLRLMGFINPVTQ